MLAACASLPAAQDNGRTVEPAAAPVVRTEVKRVLYCPAELDQDVPAQGAPAPGAVIEANDLGTAWLKAQAAWGRAVLDLLLDARAACEAARLLDRAEPARP